MSERISVTIDQGVADVVLTRGDKMNALDDAMFAALIDTAEQLGADKSVRCVVLSGEGRAFCAGLDMGNFGKMADGDDKASTSDITGEGNQGRLEKRTHGIANRPQYAAWAWRELPMPVIAAVHGVAFGGGLQICLGADMRYLAPGTRMSVMEIKWGLVPDMAGTQIMRHLVRDDIVRELTYTGRIFSAEEALDYGFATRLVDDPHAEALTVAREIANKSPSAIRSSKHLLTQAPLLSPADGLLLESTEQDKIIGKPNQVEAIMSNMEKRAPNFID
ncbi:MAG: crotonase/enoyl-CoA hydratase family protein [Parvibaculaceae bacterium]|nr:crotonase/enoyl-CoA hydratase family protein [Parvibaculaceae bacterium]